MLAISKLFLLILGSSLSFAESNIVRTNITRQSEPLRIEAKSEFICRELKYPVKKTVCDYMPVNESPAQIQSRILCQFSGCRQFPNPDEAYVKVLNNGLLEFVHTDLNIIDEILKAIPGFDDLDTYVARRRVYLDLRVYEILKNADDNLDFMVREAAYTGSKGKPMEPGNRFSLVDIAGTLSPQLALGNLVSSLLTVALRKLDATSDIKKLSNVPVLELTHGTNLSSKIPNQSQNIYITPNQVSTFTEQAGVRFGGEVRFLKDMDNRIKISNFSVQISQVPSTAKTDGYTPGLPTFGFSAPELHFDIGCAQVIPISNTLETVKKKEKWLFGKKESEEKVTKDFIIVIQVLDYNQKPTGELPVCENTIAKKPESP